MIVPMGNIEKLVIATGNPGKIEFYRQVFEGIVGEVIGLSDLDIKGKPEETGDTAEENAEIKARFYATQTDLPVFSIDESLFVDFLDEAHQPGTHVRRINGQDEVTDDELFNYWENLIKDLPDEQKTGFWHFAYALCHGNNLKIISTDQAIRFFYPASKIRIPGWPMSSLEGPIELGKPHSEKTKEEEASLTASTASIVHRILNELIEAD